MKQRYGKFDLEFVPDLSAQGNATGTRITPRSSKEMGEMFQYNLKFAKDKARILYVFDRGVYRPVGDDICVAGIDVYTVTGETWTTNKDSQVMDFLTKKAPELLEKPLEDRINLRNGLYFIEDDRFESHSEVDHSDYLTTVQVPIDYDPNVTCPNITQFMQDIFPEGWELLFDVMGICMTSVTSGHMAVILLGGGCNGKSVYLHGLRSLIGFDNASTTPMHTLADTRDRFANNDLVHKLVNCGDDTQMDKILETANIKSIISGNPIRVEGKFRNATTYKPFCKLVFASNHRLSANDDTLGYSRRIMHIPLSRTFAKDPEKERELLGLFNDPLERSGVFNEIRKRLRYTVRAGFIIPNGAEDLVNNYDPIPMEVEDWLKKVVIEDKDSKVPVRNFFTAYLFHTERVESIYRVTKYLQQLFPSITKGRPRIDGKQVSCYVGMKVIDEETNVTMSRVISETAYLEEEGWGA